MTAKVAERKDGVTMKKSPLGLTYLGKVVTLTI